MISVGAPIKVRETTSIHITLGVRWSSWTSLCVLGMCLEARLIGIPGPSQTNSQAFDYKGWELGHCRLMASLTEDDSHSEHGGSQQVLEG